MDPNTTLSELRSLLGRNTRGYETCDSMEDHYKAEELFQALDQWLLKAGALPTDWSEAQRTRELRQTLFGTTHEDDLKSSPTTPDS